MTEPSAGSTDLLGRWLAQLSAVRQRSPKTVEAYRREALTPPAMARDPRVE